MFRRLIVVGFVGVGLIIAACGSQDRRDDGAQPSVEETPAPEVDLAGELGPNGGIMSGSHELQSTPRSVFPDQANGATAVGPVHGLPAGLSVLRDEDLLCIELHGLPIGGNLLGRSCDIPAYGSHEEVEDMGRAYVSEVDLDGRRHRVAWGMTYLEVATVDAGLGADPHVPDGPFPFWMHRFFAFATTADATEVRLLDEVGEQIGTLPLVPPPAPA